MRVVAENEVDRGEPSPESSATPATTPLAPAGVDADRGDRSVTVSWAAADGRGADVTGYRLQWRAGDDGFADSDSFVDLGGSVLSRRIGSLVNGTEYFVRVRATNAVGDSGWSEASATPATTPAAPAGLDLDRGDGSIEVSWQAADGRGSPVTGYEVQWSDDGFSQSIDTYDAAAGAETYEIADLVNGTEYTVRVRAINDVDVGLWSSASATPAATPLAPTGVDADRGDRSVTVSWAAADGRGADVTGYRLQWRAGDDGFADSDSFVDLGGSVLSRRIGSLVNGTEYFVRVRATNAVGDSGWSPPASATPATTPAAPGGLELERGDGSLE